MVQIYPLSLAQFFDLTEVQVGNFTLPDSRQFDMTGGGEILDASLGSRLWRGEVTLVPQTHKAQLGIEALIEVLMEPGASFFAYDKRGAYPAADPTGSILGASTPTLDAVQSSGREVRVAGLPSGYTLTRGDQLAFAYSSAPTRYALHRVVDGDAAAGAGKVTVEVTPPVRAGYTVASAVTLIKPAMLAKITPGSYRPSMGGVGRLSTGVTFGFTQTLRG
jgi:hypothetical protein